MSISKLKPTLAFFLAFLIVIGLAPTNIQAQESSEVTLPEFIHLDGERIYLDDERIINFVPVTPPINSPRARSASGMPPVNGIVAVSAEFNNNPNVSMDGTVVSSIRYAAVIEGIAVDTFKGYKDDLKFYTLLLASQPKPSEVVEWEAKK